MRMSRQRPNSESPVSRRSRRSFLILELVLVACVLGLLTAILLAIRTPQRHQASERSADARAESNLRNGLVAAKTYWTNDATYAGFGPGAAKEIEPSINWLPTGQSPRAGNDVVIANVQFDQVLLIDRSASGVNFAIASGSGDPAHVTYCRSDQPGTFRLAWPPATPSDCYATSW